MSFFRRWVRPAGAIGFLALTALIAAFWLLAIDWLAKAAIERGGTAVLGAKVELDRADVTLSPLGLRLTRLQLTNPEKPMENIVEIASASGLLDLEKLLIGHVIVEELKGTGLQFNSARKSSGAIEQPVHADDNNAGSASQTSDFSAELAAFQDKLPSVEEILANEKLMTVERATALKSRVEKDKMELEQALAAVPDEQKLKQYADQIAKLTQGDIKSIEDLQARKAELDRIKADIKRDKEALLALRDKLKSAKDGLSTDFAALKAAPQADLAQLKSRYSLGGEGTSGLARLLFGDTVAHWLQLLQSWYQRLSPWLPQPGNEQTEVTQAEPERGTGRLIHFPTLHPLPDFLIKLASIDGQLAQGNVHFAARDITHQPQILGRPIQIDAAGMELVNVKRIAVTGTLDHTDPEKPNDTLNWTVQQWRLTDVALSRSATLPLSLARSVTDVTVTTTLLADELEAEGVATFREALLSSTASDGLAGQLAQALSGIRDFDLGASVSGPFTAPNISLRSNLDTKLKNIVSGKVKEKQAELEQKLTARLNAQIDEIAGPYNERIKMLTQSEGSLDQRLAKLEEMAKTELKSVTDAKRDEAKDALKEKLKGIKF